MAGGPPLAFEADAGRSGGDVRFVARAPSAALLLRDRGPEFTIAGRTTVRIELPGARADLAPLPVDRLPGVVNSYIGDDPSRWRTGIPTYGSVRYERVWPGIDLVFHGRGGELEYDFVVAPGADPGRVALRLAGDAGRPRVDGRGRLVVTTPAGRFVQRRPVVYQRIDGRRRPVPGRFAVGGHTVRFVVGDYDRTRPLVIDPVILYSTFHGGSSDDEGSAIAVDANGQAVVVGTTASADLPTAAAADGAAAGTEAFVTRLSADGQSRVFSTYLGGTGADGAAAVAVTGGADPRIAVAGATASSDFPTAAAAQPVLGGQTDAFVTLLSANGTVVGSTYLGGSAEDRAADVDFHDTLVRVVGHTESDNFPTVAPGLGARGGGRDGFLAGYASGLGTQLLGSYVGWAGSDALTAVEHTSTGAIRLAGQTNSTGIGNVRSAQANYGGGTSDGFLMAADADVDTVTGFTYHGGNGAETGLDLALDGLDRAYLTGTTSSTNHPLVNGFDGTLGGPSDVFVARYAAGGAREHSTLVGDDRADTGSAIAVGADARVWVAGSRGPFPGRETGDAAVWRLPGDFSGLIDDTSLDGAVSDSADEASGIATVGAGSAYVTGRTLSPDFPTLNPVQPDLAGGADAFVVQLLNDTPDTTPPDTGITAGPSGPVRGTAHEFTLTSTESPATFVCSLDGVPVEPCGSPLTLEGVGLGPHTLTVASRDEAGNLDPTPATRTFSVFSTSPVQPDTQIASGPSGDVRETAQQWTFAASAAEPGLTFECALDDDPFKPCVSPHSIDGIGYGDHVFSVRLVDAGGVPDPTPATRAFRVLSFEDITEIPLGSFAGNGSPDPRFGSAGVALHELGAPVDGSAVIHSIARDGEGRIVATGVRNATIEPLAGQRFVARFNQDGSIDPSFGDGGVAAPDLPDSLGERIVVAADGTLLVAGTMPGHVFVERYDSAGRLVDLFGDHGRVELQGDGHATYGADLAVRGDGAVVVTATATLPRDPEIGDGEQGFVFLLGDDGELETAAWPDTGDGRAGYRLVKFDKTELSQATAVTVEAQDRVLVAGNAVIEKGGYRELPSVLRLTREGALDKVWGGDGTVSFTGVDYARTKVNAVAVTPTSHVLVGGTASSGTESRGFVLRFNFAGGEDISFGDHGLVMPQLGQGAAAIEDVISGESNEILLAGRANESVDKVMVAALRSDGTPDTGFADGDFQRLIRAAPTAGSAGLDLLRYDTGTEQRLLVGGYSSSGKPGQAALVQLGGRYHAPIARLTISPPSDAHPPRPGQLIRFSAAGSSDPDRNGEIVRYRLFFGDGRDREVDDRSSFVLHTYDQPGTYQVRLQVFDREGLSDEVVQPLTVAQNQVPRFPDIEIGPRVKFKPVKVLVEGATDPDGRIVEYRWAYGPVGQPGVPNFAAKTATTTEPRFEFVPQTMGEHYVEVTVVDDEGATNGNQATFFVEDASCELMDSAARVPGTSLVFRADCRTKGTGRLGGRRYTEWQMRSGITLNGMKVVTPREETGTRTSPLTIRRFDDGEVAITTTRAATVSIPNSGEDFVLSTSRLKLELAGDRFRGFTFLKNLRFNGFALERAPDGPVLAKDGSAKVHMTLALPDRWSQSKQTSDLITLATPGVKAKAAQKPFTMELHDIQMGALTVEELLLTLVEPGTFSAKARGVLHAGEEIRFGGSADFAGGDLRSASARATLGNGIPIGPLYLHEMEFGIQFRPIQEGPCVKDVGKHVHDVDDGLVAILKELGFDAEDPVHHDHGQPTFAICGKIGLSLGPKSTAVFTMDGGFNYTTFADRPNVLKVTANGYLKGMRIAGADLTYASNGYVYFGADFHLGIDGVVTADGGISFEYFKGDFNARANVRGCIVIVDVCGYIKGIASNIGIAACIGIDTPLGDVKAGAGVRWDDPWPPDLFVGCGGIYDYEVHIPKPTAARAAQAEVTVGEAQVTGDRDQLNLAVKGRHGLPKPVLVAPDGTRVAAPIDGIAPLIAGGVVVLQAPGTLETVFLVRRPARGTYRVVIPPGTPAVAQVREGYVAPRPEVRVRVARRDGGHQLTVRARIGAGETLRIVEQGASGAGASLAEVSGGSGRALALADRHAVTRRVRFQPAATVAESRRLYAVLEQDGRVVDRWAVGSYRAPKPRGPAAPNRLKVTLRGDRVTVSWRKPRGATGYEVEARFPDGRVLRRRPGGARIRFRAGAITRARPQRIRVSVRARNASQILGPAARARGPKPPARRGTGRRRR